MVTGVDYLPYHLLPSVTNSSLVGRRSRREGALLHRKGGVGSHRVDVFAVSVFACGPCTDGVFVWEGIWRNTHSANDITAYRAAGRNATEKGEALWRRGKDMGGEEKEEKKRRKRLGQGKSATPTNGQSEKEKRIQSGEGRHVCGWFK